MLQAKKLTMDEYAMNHPAGRIGKRLILKVGDVMKKSDDLPISSADASLMSELVKLSSAGVGCLLVRLRYVVARGLEVAASHTSPLHTRSTGRMEPPFSDSACTEKTHSTRAGTGGRFAAAQSAVEPWRRMDKDARLRRLRV